MKNKYNVICPLCWGLTWLLEDQEATCQFCDSELCAMSFYEPLNLFLEKHTVEILEEKYQNQKKKIKATHWWRDRRHRFYLQDFLKNIKVLIKLKKQSIKRGYFSVYFLLFL